jgi:hypothetical protein
MWTNLRAFASVNTAAKRVLPFMVLLALQRRYVQSQTSSPEGVAAPTRPELVVLMDINPDQEKVMAGSLAINVVQKLGEKGFSFSLIWGEQYK